MVRLSIVCFGKSSPQEPSKAGAVEPSKARKLDPGTLEPLKPDGHILRGMAAACGGRLGTVNEKSVCTRSRDDSPLFALADRHTHGPSETRAVEASSPRNLEPWIPPNAQPLGPRNLQTFVPSNPQGLEPQKPPNLEPFNL